MSAARRVATSYYLDYAPGGPADPCNACATLRVETEEVDDSGRVTPGHTFELRICTLTFLAHTIRRTGYWKDRCVVVDRIDEQLVDRILGEQLSALELVADVIA